MEKKTKCLTLHRTLQVYSILFYFYILLNVLFIKNINIKN